MSLGPMQLIIIALVILVFFGRGKISEMMGDFGKGIKSFKKGINEGEGDDVASQDAKQSAMLQAPAKDPNETSAANKEKSQDKL